MAAFTAEKAVEKTTWRSATGAVQFTAEKAVEKWSPLSASLICAFTAEKAVEKAFDHRLHGLVAVHRREGG